MLKWLSKKLDFSEINQLSKDASVVIAQARQMFGDEGLKIIAKMITKKIDQVHTRYGEKKVDLKRALGDCKIAHREARQRNDQQVFSAMTLVIIYIRAEILGAKAVSVCREIESFIDVPFLKE